MKKIDKNTLKKAAEKLMFTMSEDQYDTLLKEFDIFLQQLDIISEIPNVDDAEPMIFPFEVSTSFLREDIADTPLEQKEVLKNASDVEDGKIRLPKVVGWYELPWLDNNRNS